MPAKSTAAEILKKPHSLSDSGRRDAMSRFGINVREAFGGIRVPMMKKMAREIGRDHRLAEGL